MGLPQMPEEVEAHLGEAERGLLSRIAGRLSLAADIAQADLSLLVQTEADSAVIVAHVCPFTAGRLHTRPRAGQRVSLGSDLALRRALELGRAASGVSGLMVRGIPIEQRAAPLKDRGQRVVAALNIERSLLLRSGPFPPHPLLKQAARSLARLLFENALDPDIILTWLLASEGIALADEEGRLLYAEARSEEIHQLLGWPESLVGGGVERPPPPAGVVLRTARSELHEESEVELGESVFAKRVIPLSGEEGVSGALWLVSDISALRHREGQLLARAAVVQEIHHRVKNNLQTVASLLRMEMRRAKSKATQEALGESIARIDTIAAVHDFLSQEGTEAVDLPDLLRSLLSSLAAGAAPGLSLQVEVAGPPISLPARQAAPVALVVNELVQNAIKHAFPRQKKGLLRVELSEEPSAFLIEVKDDGVGLPEGFSLEKDAKLGLQIVGQLVRRDLGGSFELQGGNGACAVIRFPKEALEEATE